MRMREYRDSIVDSLSTTQEVESRDQLVQLIIDRMAKNGFVVTDKMIHISHYGFDERIGWDEHIIVVDGRGVFGFTDGPCPEAVLNAGSSPHNATEPTIQQLTGAEVDSAYGVDR